MKRDTKRRQVDGMKKAARELLPSIAEAAADLGRTGTDASARKLADVMRKANTADAAMTHPDTDNGAELQLSVFRGKLSDVRIKRRLIESGSAADAVLALPAIAAKLAEYRASERHLTETIRALEAEALGQAAAVGDAEPSGKAADDLWLLPEQRRQ